HDRPWRIEHPLQPFDPRYFDGSDPRLYSHQQGWAELPRGGRLAELPPFVDSSATAPAEPPAQLELGTLKNFWSDPARQVLAHGLQLRLDALDADRLPDSEPLEPRVDARERLSQRLLLPLLEGWPARAQAPERPPAWLRLSGLLPPGRLGEAAWQDERRRLAALLDRLRAQPGFGGGHGRSIAVDQVIDGCRVTGEVAALYPRRDGGHWLL